MPTMMLFGGAALLLCGLAAVKAADALPAQATQTTRAGGSATVQGDAESHRKPRIRHLPSPSEESRAQRDRRLARECSGRPNAGACLGYAAAAAARPRGAAQRR